MQLPHSAQHQAAFSGWGRRAFGMVLAVAAFLFFLQPARAQITWGNFDSSGSLAGSAGDDSFTTGAFINNGDFLVVSLGAGDDNGDLLPDLTPPTVTFGSQVMTLAGDNQRSNRDYAAIYYLENPNMGSFTFTVDFGADVMDTDGAINVGYLSLFNVDETNPIAASGPIQNNATETISAISDPVLAGDLLLVSITADNSIDYPQYTTATGQPTDTSTQIYSGSLTGNPRDVQSYFVSLVDGDIDGAGDVVLSLEDARSETGLGIVFNAIPEPTSAAMILGGLALIALRRRRA